MKCNYHEKYTPQEMFTLLHDSPAAVCRLVELIDRSAPCYMSRWDIEEMFDLAMNDEKAGVKYEYKPDPTFRDQASMRKSFITKPGDVFTVRGRAYILSDSIEVRVQNSETDEDFLLSLVNKLSSWELLRKLNNMGARKVLYHYEDLEPQPFTDSLPYLHRFSD